MQEKKKPEGIGMQIKAPHSTGVQTDTFLIIADQHPRACMMLL